LFYLTYILAMVILMLPGESDRSTRVGKLPDTCERASDWDTQLTTSSLVLAVLKGKLRLYAVLATK
jgi:hypothetical protein